MRVLVCGGRGYGRSPQEQRLFKDFMLSYLCDFITDDVVIIQGGAKGADRMAKTFAEDYDIPYEEYLADWDTYGKRAGVLRNIQMLEVGRPDVVIAFPGGKGTAHMARIAEDAGILVEYVS